MQRFAAIIFLLLPLLVLAQLSPGKLSRAHSNLEGLKNCAQCHARKQQVSAESCLNCHTLLKERITANKGLHARPEYKECQKCHVEHQGLDYALIWWPKGKESFDHRETGYELLGKHKTLKCEQCHQAKNIVDKSKFVEKKMDVNKTFLGLRQDCLSCHTDEHRAQMAENCTTCHSLEQWKPAARFSHATARFPLVGRHETVACAKCHPVVTDNKWPDNRDFSKFKGLEFETCTDCHKDPHNNRFGQNCEKCHSPNGWSAVKTTNFDHSRTRFPLLGRHERVTCEECHVPGRSIKIARFDRCTDCHQDYHRGQFAKRAQKGACEECHTVQGFSPATFTIEQHQKTDFRLEGSHLAVPCILCHTKSKSGATQQFTFSSTRCVDCHTNPHQRTVDKYLAKGGCEFCHSASSWRTSSFDHSQTGFVLAGRHKETTCTSCHKPAAKGKSAQLAFTKLSQNCQDCHNDVHLGQLRDNQSSDKKAFTRCERCHTPTDWLADKFDHNRDARFKIDGAHKFVKCEQCHKQVAVQGKTVRLYKLPRTDCNYCHAAG